MALSETDVAKIAELREVIRLNIEKRDDATAEIRAASERMRPIQRRCLHTNGYKTSCMGDPGFHCPDCGYTT